MSVLSNTPFFIPGNRKPEHLCLFLHGLGGGIYEMQPLAQFLQGQGYSTCGILYPGHDQPQRFMPNSCWQDWAAQIDRTYQQMKKSYANITVIGFSTGCLLALNLVLSHLGQEEGLQSLVLMAPYFRIRRYGFFAPEWLLYSVGYLVDNLPRLNFPVRDPEMRKAAHEAAFFQTFNLSAVRSADTLIQLLKPRLNEVTLPTLIFQSPADSVVDPSGAQFLFDQLSSDRKFLEWLRKSDHIIPLDVEREFVFQRTAEFLSLLETCR